MAKGAPQGSVGIAQLAALNDEIAALVRAGIPLERGLVQAADQLRGRLGGRVGALGEMLGRGVALPDALGPEGLKLPEVYRAVVVAGTRSGRLASALEGMAELSKGYAEARRALGLALLYPLMVLALAYGLFAFFAVQILPAYRDAFGGLGLASGPVIRFEDRAGRTAIYWLPIAPVVVALGSIRWWASGRAGALDSGPTARLPWVGRMILDFRASQFADLLALLLDHQVPLDEAVRLAADASGPGPFRRQGRDFADHLALGGGPRAEPAETSAFPPLLAWMLTAGHRQGDLPVALREASRTYRRRAEGRAEVIRSALPVALLLGIGGGAVLTYALLLLIPLRSLWDGLAIPGN